MMIERLHWIRHADFDSDEVLLTQTEGIPKHPHRAPDDAREV